jgi:hypothetical protein
MFEDVTEAQSVHVFGTSYHSTENFIDTGKLRHCFRTLRTGSCILIDYCTRNTVSSRFLFNVVGVLISP